MEEKKWLDMHARVYDVPLFSVRLQPRPRERMSPATAHTHTQARVRVVTL